MIGKSGERGSGISVLPARHDDDDIVSSFSTNSNNSMVSSNYLYLIIVICLPIVKKFQVSNNYRLKANIVLCICS